jgi:VWFA-related protein
MATILYLGWSKGITFFLRFAMPCLRGLLCAVMLIAFPATRSMPQSQLKNQSGPSNIPTIQVTSRLVFLDVTVLDKEGNPVVNGLRKDDFTVTEDKKPQRIFSFEPPQLHILGAAARDDNANGEAPVTIFVLDLLNSQFEDFAFIRHSVRKYLVAQPPQLSSPAEMMVIGNDSLEMVQGYTRNKEDLLFALDHIPATLPYKIMNGSFSWERFAQSVDALQQIALQNQGVPGRKNVVWVGHGGPGVNTTALSGQLVERIHRYVHETTNMLVDARVSLFVIYPGLKVRGRDFSISAMDANADVGDSEPFAGDVNFGVFVNETGGKLFFNRNDVDAEIRRSQQLGSEYYTLTYQPHEGNEDGKFRRIRVTLSDSNLQVVTKAGYFAPDKSAPGDPRQQAFNNMAEAARSVIPFAALDVKVYGVVQHPDSHTAGLTILLRGKNLDWQPIEDGKSTTQLHLAAASLRADGGILASKVERVAWTISTHEPARLAKDETTLTLTIRVPRETNRVRVVIATEDGGRIGATDLDRKTIDSAPSTPSPEPQLVRRQIN